MVHPEAGFGRKTLCLGADFPHPGAPGCSRVLQHPWRGHVLNPQAGTSPTSPRRGDPSPWGPALWHGGPPPGLDHARPPQAHPGPGRPIPPSPRAGTDGVCPDLMSILDFPARSQGPGSGRASPHRPHRRGFHSPTARALPGEGARCLHPCGQPALCPPRKRCQGRQGRSCPASLGTAEESPQFRAGGFWALALHGVSLQVGGGSWGTPWKAKRCLSTGVLS